ncbi:MAG: hypothetical protein QME27_02975 [Syntrophaceae bacterium]|nr:hypothetical protein [Syntrophaceae bacterium]
MTDAKKERYRRIRGAILKLLAKAHKKPIDFVVLQFLLDDLGYTITEEELDSHLAYLADPQKECVRIERRKTTGIEIKFIFITKMGLDVLDGFEPDSGVDVRF